MPRYEFECKKCERVNELTRKYDERDEPATCKECGEKMERMISKTLPPIFSGSGWTPKHYR